MRKCFYELRLYRPDTKGKMGPSTLQFTGRNLGPIFTVDTTIEDPADKKDVVNRDTPLLHINGMQGGNSIEIPCVLVTSCLEHFWRFFELAM